MNGVFAMRALQTQLTIDFISVELTTARTMTGIAKIEVRRNHHGSVDQARARTRSLSRGNPARRPDDCVADPQEGTLLAPERRRTLRVDEDGVLFSARRARLAGRLHPVRSDRAPEAVV